MVEGLESIYFGQAFDQYVQFPDSLNYLHFDDHSEFDHPIQLPAGLKSLSIGPGMTHRVILPAGLERLAWHNEEAIKLPPNLKHAVFGYDFQQRLDLPPTLETIQFQGEYNRPLTLPPGCKRTDSEY